MVPTKESLEDVEKAIRVIRTLTLGDSPETTEPDVSRYTQVFGDVSDQDVAALDQYLENRTILSKQASATREAALAQMEAELAAKFRNRISKH